MRIAKTESLKKDIEIISQNHERDVDRKDAILQMIDRDLEEAEDQYQMSLRSNLMNIDQLIKLHDTRLYALERVGRAGDVTDGFQRGEGGHHQEVYAGEKSLQQSSTQWSNKKRKWKVKPNIPSSSCERKFGTGMERI